MDHGEVFAKKVVASQKLRRLAVGKGDLVGRAIGRVAVGLIHRDLFDKTTRLHRGGHAEVVHVVLESLGDRSDRIGVADGTGLARLGRCGGFGVCGARHGCESAGRQRTEQC